jgi:hypothetical protein
MFYRWGMVHYFQVSGGVVWGIMVFSTVGGLNG